MGTIQMPPLGGNCCWQNLAAAAAFCVVGPCCAAWDRQLWGGLCWEEEMALLGEASGAHLCLLCSGRLLSSRSGQADLTWSPEALLAKQLGWSRLQGRILHSKAWPWCLEQEAALLCWDMHG